MTHNGAGARRRVGVDEAGTGDGAQANWRRKRVHGGQNQGGQTGTPGSRLVGRQGGNGLAEACSSVKARSSATKLEDVILHWARVQQTGHARH